MKGKIQYHLRSKHTSIDKSNQQILTSSPVIELDKKSKSKLSELKLDKNLILDDPDLMLDTSFRNTIQSINERDNVNYLVESSTNNESLFKTALKKNKVSEREMILDSEDNYVNSSNKLLETILDSLDYFKKVNDISFRNEDKVPTIKILKDDYERMRSEYDNVLTDNKKLKEKYKAMKEKNSYSTSESSNLNANKLIDSLIYLQNKNEEIEKLNKILKSENEKLKEKLKNKRVDEDERQSSNKKLGNSSRKSQSLFESQKIKNDQMESLLKEQISCMRKMLVIVQDKKDIPGNSSNSKRNIKYQLDSESERSNIHFEESFNVTNMSNSIDYLPEGDTQSVDKDSSSKNRKYEVQLKPYDKNKKTIEAVIQNDALKNKLQNSNSKEPIKESISQSAKSKSYSSNFSVNYTKQNKKLVSSHRVFNK